MSERLTNILGYLTLIVIMAAIWALFGEDPSKQQGGRGEPLFTGLEDTINTASIITLTQGDQTIHIRKSDAGWSVDDRQDYSANAGLIRGLLRGLVIAKREEPKTTNIKRMAKLELDSAAWQLSIKSDPETELVSVKLGKHRTWQGDATLTYVLKDGDTRAWEVSGLIKTPKDIQGWLAKDVLNIDSSRVKSISLNDGTVFKRSVDSDVFTVPDLKVTETFDRDWSISGDVNSLAHMQLLDVTKMTNPMVKASHKVTLVTHDGLSIVISTYQINAVAHAKVTAESIEGASEDVASEAATIAKSVEGWMFKLPENDAKILSNSRAAYVDTKKTEEK